VWCVYDRDVNRNLAEATAKIKDDVSFDESINTAKNKGFNVAWSNDAFELWVLLHFEDIDPTDEKWTHRDNYYSKLTEIFTVYPNPNEDLEKAKNYPSFGYKKDLKKQTNFLNIVRPSIIPNTTIAAKRAKELEKYHIAKSLSHEKVPCTLVYKLVEELLATGGKQLKIEI
jgi:hypothetical protein